jgi:hypothetical protein
MSRAVVAPATIGVPTPLVAVDWQRAQRDVADVHPSPEATS